MILRAHALLVCLLVVLATALPAAAAEEPASAAGPLMQLLKSGRLPEQRLGLVIEMACRRGNAADLGYIYQQVIAPEGLPRSARLQALHSLAEAAETRKVGPEGDLTQLRALIEEGPGTDTELRLAAMHLAGVLQVEALAPTLEQLALEPETTAAVRRAAVEALVRIGGEAANRTAEQLVQSDRPQAMRYLGVAAMARLDVQQAARRAVEVLQSAQPQDNLQPLLQAFLTLQGGSEVLAQAIGEQALPQDVAKVALRTMYGLGRSDAQLIAALSDAAGVASDVQPLTPDELQRLIAEVEAHGDPQHGEEIFRRKDLNCMKCHAVSKAGGDVGPDLSALGSSSPVDYVVRSILTPDESIKEEYQTLVVLTVDGDILQGVVADRDDQRIVLKDATGQRISVPVDDIEQEKVGGSLMPKGLSNFLTHQEFLDLVSFLSQLGKPGPYEIRSTPTLQRWQVLVKPAQPLIERIPSVEELQRYALGASGEDWAAIYAKVAGDLPLKDALENSSSPVVYLRGEVEVTVGGPLTFRIQAPTAVQAWVDDEAQPSGEQVTVDLKPGRHSLVLRLDASGLADEAIRVEVVPAAGSAAQFTVVGGR